MPTAKIVNEAGDIVKELEEGASHVLQAGERLLTEAETEVEVLVHAAEEKIGLRVAAEKAPAPADPSPDAGSQ